VRLQTVLTARVARNGLRNYFEVDLSRNHPRLHDGTGDWGVLPVIVVGAEERVHEEPVDEPVFVRAAFEQLADRPVQVLDGNH
jgi:hypothetical protein